MPIPSPFHERTSRLCTSFRWKDWADYRSCSTEAQPSFLDQAIGTGDGARTQFQLTKSYTSGGYSYLRTIKKPVAGSVSVGKAGVLQTSGWTVDTTTGLVTFAVAPGSGQVVTAGFEFDVPVRFDADSLIVSIEAFNHGTIPNIAIKEILP